MSRACFIASVLFESIADSAARRVIFAAAIQGRQNRPWERMIVAFATLTSPIRSSNSARWMRH